MAAFMFRRPAVDGLDYHDAEAHKRLLIETYAGDGWHVPALLERVRTSRDLYLDSVSKVVLSSWSRGRVALVGDAGSCVSLFGDGSTLAIAGAHTLARSLAAHRADHTAAFRAYEDEHRKLVDPRMRGVARGAAMMVPASRFGIAARNLATRFLPAVAVVRRLGSAGTTLRSA
jgi:2-polyprenyl-6-methoxyphenol hydroxylase-like FAD-dependent oxidoreductase